MDDLQIEKERYLHSMLATVLRPGQTVTQQDTGGYYAVKLIENLPSGAKAYNILPFNRYVGGVSLSIVSSSNKQYILFASSSSLTYPNNDGYIARIYYY